jgi:hypothetical protein
LGREIRLQHVQREHKKRRYWQEIDQEDQKLLRTHQLQGEDPEPEIDLEGEVSQPKRGVAYDYRDKRDQK